MPAQAARRPVYTPLRIFSGQFGLLVIAIIRTEAVNLSFAGKPKQFRLLRVGAPITIKGRLGKPKMGVDIAKATLQLAVSVALGAFLQPLAALLPLVGAGLAKDANCGALVGQAQARGAPVGRPG